MELLILAVPLGILIGWIAGGNLKNLEKADIRLLYLPIVAFLLRFFVNSPSLARNAGLEGFIGYFPALNVLAYAILFFFCLANIRLKGMIVFFSGALLNAIPIFSNGGKMPFEIEAAEKYRVAEYLLALAQSGAPYLPSSRSAKFWWLGDYIPMQGLRMYKLVSIGDVVIFLALVLIVVEIMRRSGNSDKNFNGGMSASNK